MAVITRQSKGAELTFAEVDGNFTTLETMINAIFTVQSGSRIGGITAETSAEFSIGTTIPKDGTPPQITEGGQVLTVSYTPQEVGSKIVVEVSLGLVDATAAGIAVAAALFVNGGASAVETSAFVVPSLDYFGAINLKYVMTSASILPIVFAVRVGPSTGTAYVNKARADSGASQTYGGTTSATIDVSELKG